MSFSVIIPVGPGHREIERCSELLASLEHFEKTRVRRVVLMDDSLQARAALSELAGKVSFPVTHLTNPRRGRGCGWGAGLSVGILASLDFLAKTGDTGDFILKVDTDALLIRSCSEEILRRFQSAPRCAMLGAHRNFPHRSRDWAVEREPAPALEKLTRQLTVWRRTYYPWPRLQCALFPKARKLRRLILDALLAGYTLGEYCVGGAYALRGACAMEMRDNGLLKDPDMWLPSPCSEDVVVSLLVRRLGWEIEDAVQAGEPFGVGNPTLPFPPREMIEKNYAIVHPVNHKQEWPEEEMRGVFAETRRPAP